jgi:hypothetical protein
LSGSVQSILRLNESQLGEKDDSLPTFKLNHELEVLESYRAWHSDDLGGLQLFRGSKLMRIVLRHYQHTDPHATCGILSAGPNLFEEETAVWLQRRFISLA